MRTTFDAIDLIYGILNVDAVNNVIDGLIYQSKKPLSSTDQDIVILSLPISDDDLQSQTIIINAFCKDWEENGTQNLSKLKEIAEAIISALESYVKTVGTYFQYDIISQTTMNDNDQKNMSYVSIRLNCWIENNN